MDRKHGYLSRSACFFLVKATSTTGPNSHALSTRSVGPYPHGPVYAPCHHYWDCIDGRLLVIESEPLLTWQSNVVPLEAGNMGGRFCVGDGDGTVPETTVSTDLIGQTKCRAEGSLPGPSLEASWLKLEEAEFEVSSEKVHLFGKERNTPSPIYKSPQQRVGSE
ncbi:unnamed protein product [Protopolystoma xenopodis]|uniref:Uncharacterized protein n=1 Tax=Protopolystoma xenopodis TaxID=117903 RepID=A0A3S5CC02_9PLAT|nr:unnamed protein product [Protopolystoma xenopodis]